jgi:GntR family transcriptional regulator, transcriptional repressor for pyruvate dehydrogenase complex
MHESIVDRAAEAIREYVIARQLTAGQRLPSERDLAVALGTSRPALREALRRLTAERVVEVRGRSGIYIASVDLDHVFTIRLQLEPLAARLAAHQRSQAELRELQGMVSGLRKALPDTARFVAIDRRLHSAIAHISGNPVLAGFILQLNDMTLISRGLTARGSDTRHGTASDMSKLVSAIRARDGGVAAGTMSAHLERIQQALLTADPRVSLSPLAPSGRQTPERA